MPPPTPLPCSSPDCDFVTPAPVPRWELICTFITNHTQAVHGNDGAGPGATPTVCSKLDKLPHPTFTVEMTEAQLKFTEIQWKNYIQ